MYASQSSRPHFRPRLSVELFALLCTKAVALGLLYFIFFGANHRAPNDAPAVATHIMGESAH